MADVFLSYAEEDRERVLPWIEKLRSVGLEPWHMGMLPPGKDWSAEIEAELNAASAVIVFWSEHSIGSIGVKSEARRAGDRLISVRLDDVLPPYPWDMAQWVDLSPAASDPRADAEAKILSGTIKLAKGEDALPSREAKEQALAAIASATLTLGYAGRVNGLLNGLERRLEKDAHAERGPWLRSFTPELLNLTLLLAVAYPILSLSLQWVITGAEASIGAFVAFEAQAEFWWERAAICGIVALGIAIASLRRGIRVVAVAVAYVCAFALACIIAVDRAGAGPVAYAVIAAAAAADAGAIAIAVSAGLAVGGPGGAAGGVGGAFAFFVYSAFAPLAVGQGWAGRKLGAPGVMLGLFLAVLAGMLWLALTAIDALVSAGKWTPDAFAAAILFLALLPLLNAVFDFFSIGLTRYLLRKGARRAGLATIGFALLDLILGAVIFLGLAAASIATIRVYRIGGLDGTPLIDLGALFQDIAADPHAYWWLYATYFSTLLPTVLHAFVAGFGLYDWAVISAKSSAERTISLATRARLARIQTRGIAYIAGGAVVGVLAVAAALWLLWSFFTAGGAESVANGVFHLMIWWAKLIGALPADWALG